MVFRGVLLMLLAGMFSSFATASTTHEIRFVQTENILVWHNGSLIGQGAEVAVLETEAAPVRSAIGSGILVSVASQRNEIQPGIRLSIASNSAFTIETDTPDMANRVTVRLVGQGPNAKAAIRPAAPASRVIFQQMQKTAHQRGAPESQSLDLEITWTGSVRPALLIRATGS